MASGSSASFSPLSVVWASHAYTRRAAVSGSFHQRCCTAVRLVTCLPAQLVRNFFSDELAVVVCLVSEAAFFSVVFFPPRRPPGSSKRSPTTPSGASQVTDAGCVHDHHFDFGVESACSAAARSRLAAFVQGILFYVFLSAGVSRGAPPADPFLEVYAFPPSSFSFSFGSSSIREVHLFQGSRTCFPAPAKERYTYRNSYVFTSVYSFRGDEGSRAVGRVLPAAIVYDLIVTSCRVVHVLHFFCTDRKEFLSSPWLALPNETF